MDFLARREHSFYELQQKLGNKFPDADPELVNEVLTQLRCENLQSDSRFAEAYVRYRKSRGFAFHHIRVDLASRRVSEGLISQVLFEDDADWEVMATDLVDGRLPPGSPLEFGGKVHQRLLRFLESRGYPHGVIRNVVDRRLGQQRKAVA